MSANSGKRTTAAGCVLVRPGPGDEPEIVLVHRPRYDDWSLPKGKVRADESLPGCAARETSEETGVAVRLGVPVGRITYPIGGGTKTVYYWRATARRNGRHRPGAEVDAIEWLPVSEALNRITYLDERPLVHRALAQPDTTPLLVVRHAKAMLRTNWSKRDQARPLDERGRRQAVMLVPALEAYGVERLVSSTSTRCVKTLQPYAKTHRLEVEGWTTLSEEQAAQDPRAVSTLMERFAKQTVQSGVPLAICGHRPVLPTMLEAVGVPSRVLKPGAVLVAHLGADAEVVAVEIHKPRI